MAASKNYAAKLSLTPDVASYTNGFTVTTNDTTELATWARALVPTVTGTITVVTAGGDTVVWQAIAGTIYPIQSKIVKSTGTTATGITALY